MGDLILKKVIVILFIISSVYLLNVKNDIVIPKDAVRFRIIANSNSLEDQTLKNDIKKDLMNNIIPNINSKQDITESIPYINEEIKKFNVNYNINYGYNYFPEKTYKGIRYPSGNYKSLVITIDEGMGDNFWCVLYPPLCLIEEDNSSSNIEYKSIVQEIINNNM